MKRAAGLVLAAVLGLAPGRAAGRVATAISVPDRYCLRGQIIRDDTGRSFAVPVRPPERIVSLAPNVTELLFALGLGDRIAGVTRFCDFPPEALAKPRIGGLVDPSFEIIQALRPDLIFAFRGNPLRAIEKLRGLGFPVFVLDIGTTIDAIFPMVAKVGAATGRAAEAATLNARLRADLRKIETALAPVRTTPGVFLILHGQGLWTCGRDGFLDDLISRAGGRNVAAVRARSWVFYQREQLLSDDPDVILVLAKTVADFRKAEAWLAGGSRLGGLKAVRTRRVYHLDEDGASRFGPRLIEVLAQAAALLHPEAFGVAP